MPPFLEIELFKLGSQQISIEAFEQWVYVHAEQLESLTDPDLYFELLAFNYKTKHARQDFFSTIDPFFNWEKYKTWQLIQLLELIENKEKVRVEDVIYTYHLYCRGYNFLYSLAMIHSVQLYAGFDEIYVDKKSHRNDQEAYLKSHHKAIAQEAQRVKSWLNTEKIILKGKSNSYIYNDLRKSSDLSEAELRYIKLSKQEEMPKKKKRKFCIFSRSKK
jgi:hypothetical protein